MQTIPQNDPLAAAEVVSQVLADEETFAVENRSDYREPLVIPAQIYQEKFDLTLSCFARNISTGGVCLIMPQPFREGAKVTVSLLGQTTKVECAGTCCWGTKFGNTYWISGWKLDKRLPLGRMLKEDYLVEPEKRTEDRVTTAIPIYVKFDDGSTRAPGFTRNLSHDGICLVSKIEMTADQRASLEVLRLDGGTSAVESRCLWAKRYGEEHWVSGWDFKV